MNGLLDAMEKEGWNEPRPEIPDKQKKIIEEYENKDTDNLTPREFEDLIQLPAKFMNLTLEQLVIEYSHPQGMQQYANILDKIMSAAKKSVEIKAKKDVLIDREFVLAHVFSYLNILSELLFDFAGTDKKMLKDFTKMIKETQRQIDDQLKKLQKIQETAAG